MVHRTVHDNEVPGEVFTSQLDPLLCAYKTRRGTEDGGACLPYLLPQHLDSPGHSNILFVDFSYAFNTIQGYLMIQTLHQLNTTSRLFDLSHNFLLS